MEWFCLYAQRVSCVVAYFGSTDFESTYVTMLTIPIFPACMLLGSSVENAGMG